VQVVGLAQVVELVLVHHWGGDAEWNLELF